MFQFKSEGAYATCINYAHTYDLKVIQLYPSYALPACLLAINHELVFDIFGNSFICNSNRGKVLPRDTSESIFEMRLIEK